MLSPRRNQAQIVPAVIVALLLLATIGMGNEAPEGLASVSPWLDTSDRSTVLGAYQGEFSAGVPILAWDGDHGRCESGSTTAEFRLATLRRVNFYRAMAGVLAEVDEEPAYSSKAQNAAMMMSSEGVLTHTPASSFACFSTVGQEAAANSNLYLGRNGPEAIDGYIRDPGDRNVDVGHRTTILHPPTRSMGVGDVGSSSLGSSANALWVFDDRVFDEESPSLRPEMREQERYVAWPPRGYVPAGLVHPRWSFTKAGIDISEAEVAMFRPGAPEGEREVALEVISRSGTPGHVPLPTIAWQPDLTTPLDQVVQTDQLYLVVITNAPTATDSTDTAGSIDVQPGSTFAYAVRIIGNDQGDELTAAEFLGRLRCAARGAAPGVRPGGRTSALEGCR